MRILLITIAILIAVEAGASQNWDNLFNNGFGAGRGNNRGRGPPWAYPAQQDYLQNVATGSQVEWVCRNSKTNDMMVIVSDNTQQTPTRGPWWQWQNVPPNHQHHHNQEHDRHWTQPIIIVQQGPKDGNNERGDEMSNTSPETNNNNQPQPQISTPPPNENGEGLIDIRLGQPASS